MKPQYYVVNLIGLLVPIDGNRDKSHVFSLNGQPL